MIAIDELKQLLLELARLPAVSGMEQPVVRELQKRFMTLADEVSVDAFGNLVAVRKGASDGLRLMLAAHSDEVGGVVTAVTEGGFLRFHTVGVIDPAILASTRVLVDRSVPGVVICPPGHASTAVLKTGKPDLFVDIGASSREQAEGWGMRAGVGLVFDSPMIELSDPHLVMGKSLDNRIGCAVLLKLFEILKDLALPITLYGVVTVQEEIGMRGARMVTSRLMPDIAIMLDTIPLDDTPLRSMPDAPFQLGKGPVVQLWEGKAELFLGTVAHPGVTGMIQEAAEELSLPLQYSAAYGNWTTDGAAVHTTGSGVPTGYLSIPRRYGHTPNEVVNLEDAQTAIEVLRRIVETKSACFTPDFLSY